jgi:molybdopterin molybdotransferase
MVITILIPTFSEHSFMKDMLGREEVLSVNKARETLLREMSKHIPEEIETDIESTVRRITSRDVPSPEDMPGFTRSTMDGFAVHSSDTFGAREGMPAYLNLKGEVFMGEEPDFSISKGEVSRIATGGMLPAGSDSVVMFEHASEVNKNTIEVFRSVAPGENTIQAGEDCRKSEIILRKGQKIKPQDIGALAGVGITRIWVYERPVVAVIATGDEVVPASSKVMPGQVRDINSYTLSGLVKTHGGKAIKKGICQDTYDELKNTVEEALRKSSIVAITGGSSVGTRDLTAKVINSLGKPGVLFHGVSVKPGKPTIGAIIEGKPIFGLPGHPAAVVVSFELFIRPVLRLLTGEADTLQSRLKRTVMARLSRNISSSAGREDHVRVQLEEKNNELWAVPILGKSGLITTLVKADGTIVIPLNKLGLEEGTEVEVELF